MSDIANPYGSPCSDAPADTTKDSATGSPLNLKSTKAVESSSQSTPSPEQIASLKLKIAELEEEKICLARSVADAHKRAHEAETETAAAKQRAQDRYAEKMHANNAVRHLRAEVDKQIEERRSYLGKAKSCFDGLKADNLALQCALDDQKARNSEKAQMVEAQLDEMQAGFLSSQEEKAQLKAESDTIIKDLNKVIVGRQSSLEAAEKAKVSLEDELAKSKAQVEEQEKEAKAKEATLAKSIVELQKSESNWKLKFEGMQKRVNMLETHIQTAQQQTKAAQQQAQSAQEQLHKAQQNLQAAQQQTEAAQQQAKLEIAGVKQQCLMTIRTMGQKVALGMRQQPQQMLNQPMLYQQLLGQQLLDPQQIQQIQLQQLQLRQQLQQQQQQFRLHRFQSQPQMQLQSQSLPNPQCQSQPKLQPKLQPKRQFESLLQPQGDKPQEAFIPNKKRKLDANGAAFNTNALQPTHAQAFNPSPVSLMMAPNGGHHAQFPSPHPNVLAGPAAPACQSQMQQPQYCSQFTISPMQQNVLPTQATSSMKPRQPPYIQGAGFNAASFPGGNVPKPQNPPYPQGANLSNAVSVPQNNVPKPQHSAFPQGTSLEDVVPLPQNDLPKLQHSQFPQGANSSNANNMPKSQDPLLDLDFDFSQESFPDIDIDALLDMDMSQVNGVDTTCSSKPESNDADTTLPSKAQVDDLPSGLGDGVPADSGATKSQHDEDVFKDLFEDDLRAFFEDENCL